MIESRPVCPRNQLAPGTVGGWTRHVRGKLRAHPLLEFQAGENAASLGLTGKETFHVEGVKASLNGGGRKATVRAVSDAARGGILPQWRDSAVCFAAVGGAVAEESRTPKVREGIAANAGKPLATTGDPVPRTPTSASECRRFRRPRKRVGGCPSDGSVWGCL